MIDFDTYLSWQIIGLLFGTLVLFPLCLLWIKHKHSKHNKNDVVVK